jgi:hypothetical protein
MVTRLGALRLGTRADILKAIAVRPYFGLTSFSAGGGPLEHMIQRWLEADQRLGGDEARCKQRVLQMLLDVKARLDAARIPPATPTIWRLWD